ncbi:hypothetical protein [Photorhabdus australis]
MCQDNRGLLALLLANGTVKNPTNSVLWANMNHKKILSELSVTEWWE